MHYDASKLYHKYNDKLMLLWYSVDNKERKADPKRWVWERKKMFTAIRSSYLYLESLKNASLDYEKEWGFSFVYSDKNKLEGNAVVMDVGLS